jgi:hypothetical protein
LTYNGGIVFQFKVGLLGSTPNRVASGSINVVRSMTSSQLTKNIAISPSNLTSSSVGIDIPGMT